MLTVDRRQVLAYRVAAHGLHRGVDAQTGTPTGSPADLAVLDLGVQGTPSLHRVAVAARLGAPAEDGELAGGAFTTLWSFRGAPHLHRTDDLPGLAAELWPVSETDAAARLGERKVFRDAGIPALEVFAAVAEALRAVVRAPLTKGEVSRAVTDRLPAAYSKDCRGCASRHVYGGIFQQAAIFAGVRLDTDRSTTTLAPWYDPPADHVAGPGPEAPGSGTPGSGEPVGPARLLRAYLRLHGPATLREAAGYLGTSQAAVRPYWPDGLVEVDVDGARAWIPAERADLLADPPDPRLVRLLPALDPYLQARDRDLLVPDRDRQRAVWRILGNPGALLVDGEVAGVWRAKAAGKALALTIEPFGGLPGRVATRARRGIADEAALVAAARGETTVSVTGDEGL